MTADQLAAWEADKASKDTAAAQAMAQTGAMLSGAFTGTLVDMRNPSQMVVFKNDRALCIVRLFHYDMIILVSEAIFYDRASRRVGIRAKEKCGYLKDGTGMLVDLNIEERITTRLMDFDIPTRPNYEHYRHSNWFSSIY